jgi:hypothetical protein
MRSTLFLLAVALGACTPGNGNDPDTDPDTDVDTDEDTDTDVGPPQLSFAISMPSPPSTPLPCDDAALGPALATLNTWHRATSCAFASAGMSDARERLTLTLSLTVPSDDALTVGERFQVTWDPTAGESADEVNGGLVVSQGEHLFDGFCNDVLEDTPRVDTEWRPVDGWMALTVTASEGTWEPWGAGFTGDVVLRGVVVETEDGARCSVPDLDLTDLNLGWLPG